MTTAQMDMTPEERAKALSKIKKCLALSNSPEPHEAAAAMRQAQKLMDRLGVTPEEVEAPDVIETEVKTREGFGNCRYMNHLADMVATAFGVQVVYFRNPGTANRLNVRYFGPRGRAELAEYTHRVVQRALEAAWTKHLEKRPWDKSVGGKRQSFYIGWLWAVKAQVSALAPTDIERKATERFIALRHGTLTKVDARKRAELDAAAAAAGRAAAAEFSINVPLEEDQLKLEHRA
jgi:hypothetical protein